jgi:nucleoside phosphorylase
MAPARPNSRLEFEIAIICALAIEADAVKALFDQRWDDEPPHHSKAPGDPNAYSTGSIGSHNVVLTYMPGMGKVNAAIVATNCRASFPNIKLALIVGICGAVPFMPDTGLEIILGDVILSNGIIQYDLGRQYPKRFERKDTLLESLGRPNVEIRTILQKLGGVHDREKLSAKMVAYLDELQKKPALQASYPGATRDTLFHATYHHPTTGKTCQECGCSDELVSRTRFEEGIVQPVVHFGLIASGDKVMKSGEERDDVAKRDGVIGFEMEGAGIWDVFPCIVIKGVCDYADSHKIKLWQRYAAATAAACTKAFLEYWVSPAAGMLYCSN